MDDGHENKTIQKRLKKRQQPPPPQQLRNIRSGGGDAAEETKKKRRERKCQTKQEGEGKAGHLFRTSSTVVVVLSPS